MSRSTISREPASAAACRGVAPPSAGAPPAATYPALPEGAAPELMSIERVPGKAVFKKNA